MNVHTFVFVSFVAYVWKRTSWEIHIFAFSLRIRSPNICTFLVFSLACQHIDRRQGETGSLALLVVFITKHLQYDKLCIHKQTCRAQRHTSKKPTVTQATLWSWTYAAIHSGTQVDTFDSVAPTSNLNVSHCFWKTWMQSNWCLKSRWVNPAVIFWLWWLFHCTFMCWRLFCQLRVQRKASEFV